MISLGNYKLRFGHNRHKCSVGYDKPSFRLIRFNEKVYYLNFPHLIYVSNHDAGYFYVYASGKEPQSNNVFETLVCPIPLPNITPTGCVCFGDCDLMTSIDDACALFWNSRFKLIDDHYFSHGVISFAMLMGRQAGSYCYDNSCDVVLNLYAVAERNKTLLLPPCTATITTIMSITEVVGAL